MKILFAGGTAGHINPALGGGWLCASGAGCAGTVRWCKGGMEERLVPKLAMSLPRRDHIRISAQADLITLSITSKRWRIWLPQPANPKDPLHFQPDICVGTGGYASGPILRQAQKLGIRCSSTSKTPFVHDD